MQVFNLNIPISKVDEEQRIVYGYATKEELDRQGDIVDYEASKAAFSSWAGNIREQHDPKRVIGKKVSMDFDDDAKQVMVGAYISKSPDGENAWTKVKEGLFTGFSIGGKIKSIIKEKSNGVVANRIMDYDLSELSLVDVPACPSAQFVMVKSADGKIKEVEEMRQSNDGQPLPWFMKSFAYAPDQVNYFSKSSDNKDMSKESKEKSMSNDVKDVEKAVAVHAGDARDDKATPVVPEIGGKTEAEAKQHVADQKAEEVAVKTPVETTDVKEPVVEPKVEEPVVADEKSVKADMKKGLYTVADLAACVENLNWIVESAEFEAEYEKDGSTVPAQLKAAVAQVGAALVAMTSEEVAEANAGDDVDVDVELSDKPTDLMKSVDVKLEATKQDLLKSVTEAITGKVEELISPLADRLKAIESQPVGGAPQKVYTEVDKVADAEPAKDDLLAKAADMEANPNSYSPLQRADLASELLKRSSAQRPMLIK